MMVWIFGISQVRIGMPSVLGDAHSLHLESPIYETGIETSFRKTVSITDKKHKDSTQYSAVIPGRLLVRIRPHLL